MTAVDPQPVRHHPLTECLDTDAQTMSFDQLLHRERRTESKRCEADTLRRSARVCWT